MNIIKTNRRALQSGTTLVELSVVIAVILLLVGVLFISVNAWKQAANKAACLVNIATTQKAVRAYENTNLLVEGTSPLAWSNIAGPGLYFNGTTTALATPTCPSGGTYTLATTIPVAGTPGLTCSTAGHAPVGNTNNW